MALGTLIEESLGVVGSAGLRLAGKGESRFPLGPEGSCYNTAVWYQAGIHGNPLMASFTLQGEVKHFCKAAGDVRFPYLPLCTGRSGD